MTKLPLVRSKINGLGHRLAWSVATITAVLSSLGRAASPNDDGATTEAQRVGRQVADFELSDWRGKTHRLSDYAQAKVVVIAFLGTECPLAKLYAPKLNSFAKKYGSRGVQVLGVNPNTQDSITEVAGFARRHQLAFPLLKDVGNELADRLGAVRTPEVFVLDEQRVTRYWGRIDDQYGLDYARNEPRHDYLTQAVEAVLDNRAPEVSHAESVGCHIGRVRRPKPQSSVTYYADIAPILRKQCVGCHQEGEIAPFSLTDASEVTGWADMIREVVDQNRMPPWHADDQGLKFRNDRRLSDPEKAAIRNWVAAGAPIGEPRPLPPIPQRPAGWNLPREPDAVFAISDQPVPVPTEGAVEYKYFRVATGLREEKWIEAMEVRPGNRAVVHHILVFVSSPEGLEAFRWGVDGYLAGYVPGVRVLPFPKGMAKRLPPNAELIFQMHYTPIGTPQEDRSEIAFVFADPATVKYEVQTISAAQTRLRIPPRQANVPAIARPRHFDREVLLLSLNPHMHLRGQAFRYELELPTGEKKTLLNIPYYDFNWQTEYYVADPLTIPAGSKLHARALFDNSEDNWNNPDPNRWVGWGDQTWDEMMIGYITIATPRKPGGGSGAKGSAISERAKRAMRLLDRNRDGKLSRGELPQRMRALFGVADSNGDGVLSPRELSTFLRASR